MYFPYDSEGKICQGDSLEGGGQGFKPIYPLISFASFKRESVLNLSSKKFLNIQKLKPERCNCLFTILLWRTWQSGHYVGPCDMGRVPATGNAEVGDSFESGSLRPAWTTQQRPCLNRGSWEMAALPGFLIKRI